MYPKLASSLMCSQGWVWTPGFLLPPCRTGTVLGLCWDRTQGTVHTTLPARPHLQPDVSVWLTELVVFWVPGFWKLLTQVPEHDGPFSTSLLFWQICFSRIHSGHQPSEARTVHSSPSFCQGWRALMLVSQLCLLSWLVDQIWSSRKKKKILVAFWISCVQLHLYPCILKFSWSFGFSSTPSFLR